MDALELSSDSDYGLINTLINLLDFCVGNEAPKREEMVRPLSGVIEN